MNKNKVQIDLDKKIVKYVSNNSNDNIELESCINKIVELALDKNNISNQNISVSIQSASKEEIRKLNFEYRDTDRATDVLSFPIFEKEEIYKLRNVDESKRFGEIELGDIILCLDVIKEQSIEYGTGLLREILYMITHGICHLLGYDHIEQEDKKEMRTLEEEILESLGVFN